MTFTKSKVSKYQPLHSKNVAVFLRTQLQSRNKIIFYFFLDTSASSIVRKEFFSFYRILQSAIFFHQSLSIEFTSLKISSAVKSSATFTPRALSIFYAFVGVPARRLSSSVFDFVVFPVRQPSPGVLHQRRSMP